ncbi:MAG: ABC transporter permease subunit [Proteobacteria bacterium]|nr:ABC transporter permease subunit [Pseudomonadota bacterium]
MRARISDLKRWYVIGAPFLWLLVFFLIPFFIVFKLSLSDVATAIPPYTPTFSWSKGISAFISQLDFENYTFLFSDPLYINSYLSSLKIAFFSTILTLLVAYPMAYGMARAPKSWQPTLMMLVILPFWTSFLIRIYAWIAILKPEGFLSLFLIKLGLISEPLQIMNTTTAVYIGIVYSYLPFMILPLYASLEKINPSLLEAAQDLGSQPWRAFWQVTFPLSMPGVFAGCLLVFIPAVGEFVIPDLLGGSDTLMIGKTLWTEFFNNRDWPLASAVAVLLLLVLIIPIVLFQRQQEMEREAGR